jgi:hypothetical protein
MQNVSAAKLKRASKRNARFSQYVSQSQGGRRGAYIKCEIATAKIVSTNVSPNKKG